MVRISNENVKEEKKRQTTPTVVRADNSCFSCVENTLRTLHAGFVDVNFRSSTSGWLVSQLRLFIIYNRFDKLPQNPRVAFLKILICFMIV